MHMFKHVPFMEGLLGLYSANEKEILSVAQFLND